MVLPLREGTSLTTKIPMDSIVTPVNELNPKFDSEDSSFCDEDGSLHVLNYRADSQGHQSGGVSVSVVE